jgi:hypothetical protein
VLGAKIAPGPERQPAVEDACTGEQTRHGGDDDEQSVHRLQV